MASIKRNLILGGLLASALAIPSFASADEATATPVATPTPLAWYQKITVGGYVDAYYQLNLNEASSTSGITSRGYNSQTNQFTYGGGELTLKQGDTASGTGYFVDLLLGGNLASTYNGNSVSWLNPFPHFFGYYVTNPQDDLQLGQAYITQAFGNATFTLGKFATPVGYEGTYLPSDANFSRSILYANEPIFQTGLELSYNLPASLTASLWADDGNSVDNAVNNGKGYGAQLGYTGVKNLSLTGTYYLENNQAVAINTHAIANQEMTNAIASYTVSDSLSVAGEYLLVDSTGDAASTLDGGANYVQSSGYSLYATWNTPVANLSLSPRFTQWFNPNLGVSSVGYVYSPTSAGYTPYQLDDYTVTLKYQMGPVAHTLEYQATASNLKQFPGGAGNPTAGYSSPTDVQQTLTYAAIYSF